MMIVIAIVIVISFMYSIKLWTKSVVENTVNTISTWSEVIKIEEITSISNNSTKLEIINHQLLYWREEILSLDCWNIPDLETKTYCIDEKDEKYRVSKSISWEEVLKKWDEYIMTFECDTIYSDIWKNYCIEHQNILSASQ